MWLCSAKHHPSAPTPSTTAMITTAINAPEADRSATTTGSVSLMSSFLSRKDASPPDRGVPTAEMLYLLKTNIAQERSKPAPQIEIADSPRRPTPFRDKRFSAAL